MSSLYASGRAPVPGVVAISSFAEARPASAARSRSRRVGYLAAAAACVSRKCANHVAGVATQTADRARSAALAAATGLRPIVRTIDRVNDRLRELITARQIYDAWRLVHAAFEPAVYRFVLQRTRAEYAEDLCRDIWNAVYRMLPTHDANVSPRSWVFAIARAKVSERSTIPPPPTLGRALYSTRALGRSVTRRDVPALERVIAALPAGDRELMELRHVSGLQVAELATVLGTSVRMIEGRLSSTAANLRVLVGAMTAAAPRQETTHAHGTRGRGHLAKPSRRSQRTAAARRRQ